MSERYVAFAQDHDTGPYFQALAEGRLLCRVCDDCNSAIHPPTAHCPHCGSWATQWRETSGRGRLYSFSVVHHQVHPAYPTPYTLTLVELDGLSPPVRLVGSLPGAPELRIGAPMSVRFETGEDGAVYAQWDPV